MGFAWVVSLILSAWVSFTLGRKYQDLQDVLLARRVAKLVEQRRKVKLDNDAWDEIEEMAAQDAKALERKGVKRVK